MAHAADGARIELEFIPVTEDGLLDLESYRTLLSRNPRLVSFTHVSNVLGTINPAAEIIRLAHEAGAILLEGYGRAHAPELKGRIDLVTEYDRRRGAAARAHRRALPRERSAGKKRFLLFFTLLCILGTSSLYFIGPGQIFWGIFLFVLANVGFEAGVVFYDAFLPEITAQKNYGRVSGYGFGMGYFGSLATLAIVFPFIEASMIKETFPIAAAFFLIFSLPLFFFLKEARNKAAKNQSFISIGFGRVWSTLSHLKHYKNLAIFLVAYFFYIEGVNTVIFFSGNYASTTLGFTEMELLIFFIVVQTTAIVGSVLLGIVADKIGQKKTIVYSLFIWLLTVVLAYFIHDKTGFYIVGLLAGAAMVISINKQKFNEQSNTP